MSGQQIGTVVGGVIGAFFGNPQLGMAIGGMIGGWISPTQVEGPRIGDGAQQSAAEGVPIAWVLGTAGWIQGNIVQKSARREVKKTDDGKGSGTEVNTYEAHQDFCILICESSEHRQSLMAGVLMVRVDGKIVYDMRQGSSASADNAKFLRNHTFYNGAETQLPDPTLEAITGVGNTPYYRGVFTMVARDINLSQYGDRIPTYEFVMVGAGSQVTTTTDSFVGPTYGRFQNAHWPLADGESFYTFTGQRNTGTGGIVTFQAGTIAEILSHFAALGYSGNPKPVSTYLGYSASTGPSPGAFKLSPVAPQPDVTKNTSLVLTYNEAPPVEFFDATATDPSTCTILPYTSPGLPEWYGFNDGKLGRLARGVPPLDPAYPVFNNCSGLPAEGGHFPYIQGSHPLHIRVERRATPPSTAPIGDPCELGVPVALPDAPGFVIDCGGVVTPAPTYTAVTLAGLLALKAQSTSLLDGRQVFDQLEVGPIMLGSDARNTQAFWTAAYNDAVLDGKVPAGQVYGTHYPQGISSTYRSTFTSSTLTEGALALATAITRICARGGLTAADLDTSDLDQLLAGYMITQPYNGAECLRPLMTAKTCYGSEYDAKLRFHKHGEAITLVVDDDDLIESGGETEEDTREQAIEYPRLLSVTAIDPTQDYTPRPQVERRITPDVRAIGEESMQVPVVMQPDEQRELAAKGMKISWARQQGPVEFSVPYATESGTYLKLVPGKPFAFRGKRYIAERVRLEDGELHINGAYDRQSAYTANVTATPAVPPSKPPSSIGGVTLFAAMNLPRLRSKDATPGMYMAFAGLLSSWPGCYLQMSTDDGATWTTVIASATQASVLGYLTAGMGTGAGETLSVAVHGGELSSVTAAAIENEANPVAVLSAGVAEVMQFQTATEGAPDVYALTGLVRGGLRTTAAPHAQGDRFASLESVYFLPIDIGLAGRTIKFRPVTFGTAPDLNAIYNVAFLPQFTGPQVIENYTDDLGGPYTDDAGQPYFQVT